MNETKSAVRGGRVTIRTVAADAGVSVAAVSKVLRNAYGVSETLRSKVMASIATLGYRPSAAARAMRGQTFTIGILLVDIANPFLPEIVEGINRRIKSSRYKAMIGVGELNLPLESSLIESMIDHHMDGLILVSPRAPGEMIHRFAERVPIVVIAHHNKSAISYDTVNADDRLGAERAVRALIDRGHRDIMMITPDFQDYVETGVIPPREAGYLAAMANAGLQDRIRVVRIPNLAPGRDHAIAKLLSSPDRPRAIFCWSDLHGVPLIMKAKTLGIAFPEDLAIIAYDNSNMAALPLIDLASIDQHGKELGHEAANLLLSRIGGRSEARHVLVEPHLVERSSF